jgi:hypothetical protein
LPLGLRWAASPRHPLLGFGATELGSYRVRPLAPRGNRMTITFSRHLVVGSRTGAPTLGSGGNSTAFAVALSPAAIITFPAPATSNVACGSPALRSPVCFAPRLMRPILPRGLSADRAYSTTPSRSSGDFQVTPESSVRFSLRLGVYLPSQVLQTNGRRCHFALASRIAGRVTNSRAPSLRRRYSASPLLRTRPTPSRLRPLSRVAGYTAYLAPPISRRDEEGLSSCLARPCHHAVDNHPAGVAHRISLFAMIHAAFAKTLPARPPRLKVSRPPLVRLRYGLVTRRHPYDGSSVGFRILVSPLQPCYPSYGAPTFTPVGLSPTGRASLRWTHNVS